MTATAHSAYLGRSRFASLDGLRAISIISVIWHHTAGEAALASGNPLAFIGTQGVTLFFAISGFLITTLLLRERDRNGHIDLSAFYMRRALRIFPLYYGVLAVYSLLVWTMERHSAPGQAFFTNLPYFATFTSNLFVPLDGRVIFFFVWSVAAEEQFYLVWPSLLIALRTVSRALGLLLIVLLIGVVLDVSGYEMPPALQLAILAGAVVAMLLHTPLGFALLRRTLGVRLAPVLLILALVGGWLTGAPGSLLHLVLAALVASCVVREDHVLAKLLYWRPVAYVGAISYGMYMLHLLCKNAVTKVLAVLHAPQTGPLAFALTLGVTVGAAALSFRWYESWFLQLKHRYRRI